MLERVVKMLLSEIDLDVIITIAGHVIRLLNQAVVQYLEVVHLLLDLLVCSH